MEQGPTEEMPARLWNSRYWPGIQPIEAPKGFWRLDARDLVIFAIHLAVTLIFWIPAFWMRKRYAVSSYWDGPNYLSLARNAYRVDKNDPLVRHYRYQPKYFACHLPGFPMLIRLCSFACFGNFEVGFHVAIVAGSLLFVYALRRCLLAYRAVHKSFETCIMSVFVPLRWTIYRAVGASEPLFIALVLFAMTGFRLKNHLLVFLSCLGACFTRIEGLALVGTIGLSSLFRMDLLGATVTGFATVADPLLAYFHKRRFGDPWAYFKHNFENQRMLAFPPFRVPLDGFRGGDFTHAWSGVAPIVPFLLGLFQLFSVAVPFGIFASVYLIFVASLWHLDIYRYALAGYVFVVLVGFDAIWSSPAFHRVRWGLLVAHAIFAWWYQLNQLASNVCGDDHARSVMRVPFYWF